MKWTIRRTSDTISTNRDAIDLACQGADDGTVVVSRAQTGGRGRFGRNWFSPADAGLYVSVLLRPDIGADCIGFLSFCAANAARKAVSDLTGIGISIKWPNDLMIDGRKAGGILSYCRTSGEKVEFAVIGLGLNIKSVSYPAELAGIAVSLEDAGAYADTELILTHYLDSLECELADLTKNGFVFVRERLMPYLETLGKTVSVSENGTITTGVAADVDKAGALVLIDGTGVEHVFYSGDVTIVR